METRNVLFLDRDGVINVDVGYLSDPAQLEFIPGAIEAMKEAQTRGYDIIVVTNQSGVARGYYTEEDVQALHAEMSRRLEAEGVHILAYYYCPHHPEGTVEEYKKACDCRKPNPGMLTKAIEEWHVDVDGSFLVGDKPSDAQAAESIGMRAYPFEEDNLMTFLEPIFAWEEGRKLLGL
ncbi:D-glycero-beta-D-manno-heptose 1,7-bisphosphate 7-phosphatase [Veillonella sp. 3310]|jgi:D,D-heptose 1,7-bisphosphate phosphatase|uniref:D-glycero-alpha-D-manno-heptose-1,7-bisphosphate 7-phosphatase n=1 Tax=Veillonella sp. 3310 TaxID=2490956 RepID=UPI000FD622D2|nr:HAD family hydrolase [Veillonella sp. 3310]